MTTKGLKYYPKNMTNRVYPVTVFLCTPRCGTQWIAKNISDTYGDEAIVLHEPIKYEYYPRKNLGIYDRPAVTKGNIILDNHLEFVDETIQNRHYIEIGWQSIAGISELHERFGKQLKLIHLYRNPVNVAASLVTHNWYTGRVEDRFEKAELTPFDDSAILSEYRSRWDNLSLFEKSLYYWAEINLRALEIKQRYSSVPFYSLKFENLFEESKEINRITLIEMLAFMSLNYDEKMLDRLNTKYDNYHHRSSSRIEWEKIFEHPQALVLAHKLGYRFDGEIDLSRYKKRSFYQKIKELVN
ncbi:hypothetical protein CK503_14270 [Aliifodinibius salipaludis]|uniref:Sulfotransferase domain-containing protein n=1 Tax=Fodinibius salipaludis TaxID=2032627 RepID=A0A2A2G6U0_9BACT|nr:sulfotransferase domain-containing protein [Aliifodinibius salipaludis]PAU92850.1 hypothetical protein CK503_14270 [Aliifodinibius salipaludis]